MEYTFTVKRSRQSVTQGMATVYLNGIELVSFGDTIELIKDGRTNYGENIGGWASVKSDGDFVHGALFHPHENIYHCSDKARDILRGIYTKQADRQAKEGRMFIDVDAKIAISHTREETEAWEAQRERLKAIDFCAGWHVGIYKQACGHWEILQSPLYKNHDGTPTVIDGHIYTAEDADRELREDSAQRKCTRCICRF